MKYKILKSFKGSQDGRFAEDFVEGAEAELSDYLVSCVEKDWIAPIEEVENKAIATDEESGTAEQAAGPADEVENKAIATDGTKAGRARRNPQ